MHTIKLFGLKLIKMEEVSATMVRALCEQGTDKEGGKFTVLLYIENPDKAKLANIKPGTLVDAEGRLWLYKDGNPRIFPKKDEEGKFYGKLEVKVWKFEPTNPTVLCNFSGFLARDADMRFHVSGKTEKAVLSFTLSVKEKDKESGEDETIWVKFSCWADLGSVTETRLNELADLLKRPVGDDGKKKSVYLNVVNARPSKSGVGVWYTKEGEPRSNYEFTVSPYDVILPKWTGGGGSSVKPENVSAPSDEEEGIPF